MFLWPATHGMPDAFGLTFAAVILLLTADYRFDRLEPRRLVCLFAATFALVLTRRWYMFWILAYYLCYAAAVLLGAARRRVFGRVLCNLLKFGIPAVIGVVVPLLPTFVTALTTDYADIYGAFYGGGLLVNLQAQLGRQGWLFWPSAWRGWCWLWQSLRCGARRRCWRSPAPGPWRCLPVPSRWATTKA